MTSPLTPENTLLLVDGSSYLYRAFHAMPDLRAVPGDPTSAPTGAIRGIINMMASLRKEFPARYAVCVFDAPGGTFRDDLYPDYKATRSPMPPDFTAVLAGCSFLREFLLPWVLQPSRLSQIASRSRFWRKCGSANFMAASKGLKC